MSKGMNKVILMGHLGKDPELKETNSGHSRLTLRLATSERYRDQNGQWLDRTEWHDVVMWGPRAEALSRVLRKGTGVVIQGSLHTSSWEREGVKRTRTEIVAHDLQFMGGQRRDSSDSVSAPPASETSPELAAIPF